MTPKAAQEKGKRFEKAVLREMEEMGLGAGVRTPGSGSGTKKGDLFTPSRFMFECKNEAQPRFLTNVDQSKEQARIGNAWPSKWALVTMDPRTTENSPSIYVTLDLWEFLELLKKDRDPIIKEPDRDAKWKIKRAVDSLKAVLKVLDSKYD